MQTYHLAKLKNGYLASHFIKCIWLTNDCMGMKEVYCNAIMHSKILCGNLGYCFLYHELQLFFSFYMVLLEIR